MKFRLSELESQGARVLLTKTDDSATPPGVQLLSYTHVATSNTFIRTTTGPVAHILLICYLAPEVWSSNYLMSSGRDVFNEACVDFKLNLV